ncbi:MAG: cytochrome b N-terminal domain-containing protein [Planctomycetota bacterium]|nr:cytochrome b N-terminal domain-containing protein [Planctomycetota bacterium]
MSSGERGDQRTSLAARIRRSLVRGPLLPRDDRQRKRIIIETLILHFRPVWVPAKTIRYTHTFGLGGMSLVLFLLLAATGILMLFVYEPSPDAAYGSIVALEEEIRFGPLVRGIHYWSANLLVIIMVLHMLRVYLTGGYLGPRQFNWVIGLTLLLFVLLSNLTGYLLPWDQLSYWATTIVLGMIGYLPLAGEPLAGAIRGGEQVGAATLVRFYAFHTTVGPLILISLMAWHFWRVRQARGVVIPRAPGEAHDERPDRVLMVPNLLLREFCLALVLIATVMVMSLFFTAPLGEAANPGMSPNPARAPWYFAGFQELLMHFHPVFAVLVIPALAVIGLLFIPYVRYERDTSGIFMMSVQGRRLGLIAVLGAGIITPFLIVADEYWIDFSAWLPGASPMLSEGLVPAALAAILPAAVYITLRRARRVANNEAIQAMVIVLMTAFAVLTAAGAFFRGPGMALAWPWSL